MQIEFEQGQPGPGALFGFMEWVLFSRSQISGTGLFTSSPSCKLFAEDFSQILSSENVFGLAIMLGPTYLSPRECFWLDFPCGAAQQAKFDFGKQKLGNVIIQSLSSKLPAATNVATTGIYILIRVRRCDAPVLSNGFTTLDENLQVMGSSGRALGLHWQIAPAATVSADKPVSSSDTKRSKQIDEEEDEYCWLVWTRQRFSPHV